MSQDDTDNDNEGTDNNNSNNNNNNNNGDQGTKTNNEEFDEEDNHHKTTTGTETEMYYHNHTIKTVAAEHTEGDDEHGTRTEGTGDRYSAVRRGMQKMAQETSSTSLGP
jgi:hypothetical protein